MATIKPSGLVTGFKGKLQGSVLQYNSGGNIIRSNRNHNRATSQQWSLQKIKQATVAQHWRSLTDANRATWNAIVADYPTTNKWGDERIPSGYELHNRLNGALYSLFASMLDEAPAPEGVPSLTDNISEPDIDHWLRIKWGHSGGGTAIVVAYGSKPVPPGRTPSPGSYFRMNFNAVNDGDYIYYDEIYEAKYGKPAVGMVVWVKGQIINEDTGELGSFLYSQTVVA